MKILRLPKPLPLEPRARDAFARGYVESLRLEARKTRKRAEEAEAGRAEDKARADARLIQAVLRALATQARIVDLDALQLADLSSVTVDEAGDVTGAAELIEALQRDKPFIFENVVTSTSYPGKPPASV